MFLVATFLSPLFSLLSPVSLFSLFSSLCLSLCVCVCVCVCCDRERFDREAYNRSHRTKVILYHIFVDFLSHIGILSTYELCIFILVHTHNQCVNRKLAILCVGVYVCESVWERERVRKSVYARAWVSVCVCVCVLREREDTNTSTGETHRAPG